MRSKPEPKRLIAPDPLYQNLLVSKLINSIMHDGKKTVAQKQVYQALKLILQKTNQEGLQVFLSCIENVKPQMEVRARRIGGAAYQIPTPVRNERKESLAIRWLVEAAQSPPNS